MRELGIDPVEIEKARLRILPNKLLMLLKSSKAQSKINYLGEEDFWEKVYSNDNLRISTTIKDAASEPEPYPTFVIILKFVQPIRVILVPADTTQSFEILAENLQQQNLLHNTTYLPTNPQQIIEIVERGNTQKLAVNPKAVSWLLHHLSSLEAKSS